MIIVFTWHLRRCCWLNHMSLLITNNCRLFGCPTTWNYNAICSYTPQQCLEQPITFSNWDEWLPQRNEAKYHFLKLTDNYPFSVIFSNELLAYTNYRVNNTDGMDSDRFVYLNLPCVQCNWTFTALCTESRVSRLPGRSRLSCYMIPQNVHKSWMEGGGGRVTTESQ